MEGNETMLILSADYNKRTSNKSYNQIISKRMEQTINTLHV